MERTGNTESPPLDEVAVPAEEDGVNESEMAFVNPRDSQGMHLVRRHAERIADLLAFSRKPAVLITSEWHVLGTPFAFEDLSVYEAVAAGSGYVVVSIERPDAGGTEHLLFMARTNGLPDEEYLACKTA